MLQSCRICLRSNSDITKNVSDFADIIQKIAQIEVSHLSINERALYFFHLKFS